jgi:predicted Zn-dependent protease
MFRKIVVDLTILAVSFFGTWYLLSQIRFISAEKRFEISLRQEEQIGRMMKNLFIADAEIIDDEVVESAIDEITGLLKNILDTSKYTYRITIIENSDINAFSLPGGYIIIYSGLIGFCEASEELAGVIAHEMGHNENHDVLTRLAKNISITITLNSIFGGDNNKLGNILQQVISTKFDRTQEERADAFAVDLMLRCGINPDYLAQFFERLLEQKPDILNQLDFLMTHPADDKRVEAIRSRAEGKYFIEEPIRINWDELQEHCR